jgi:hypothetical protein
VREEVGNMAAFSMATDLEADLYWRDERDLLLLAINRTYYMENYRGFSAGAGDRVVSAGDGLRRHGVEFDFMEQPLPHFEPELFGRYRTIIYDSVANAQGTLPALRAWLSQRGDQPRTLVLNHVHFLHLSSAAGAAPHQLTVRKLGNWTQLGLPQRRHELIRVRVFVTGAERIDAGAEVMVFHVPAPPGAQVLVRSDRGEAVVWRLRNANGNSVVYSGLPLNHLAASQDPGGAVERLWAGLFTGDLRHPARITNDPAGPFVGLYRTGDGLPILALISDEEPRVTAPSFYETPEQLLEVVRQVPDKTVAVTVRALPAGTRFVPWDITARRPLGEPVTSDQHGTLELVVPLHLAKLIALIPADRELDAEVKRFEPYLVPWLPAEEGKGE